MGKTSLKKGDTAPAKDQKEQAISTKSKDIKKEEVKVEKSKSPQTKG